VHPVKKGLGAKKATPVDFVEAEQIHQLGYDHECKEASAQAAALELKNMSTTTTVSAGASSANVDKLVAGMKKLALVLCPMPSLQHHRKCVFFCYSPWQELPS
jgi:hypothetical protein